MNFFCRKIFTAFLFLSFAFNARAVNDSLTIGQAFNWKAGDTLVYDYFEVIYFPQPPQGSGTVYQHSKNGFAVEERADFQDTIVYHLRWKNGFADTLTLTNLDTPVTKIGYSVFYPVLGGCEELPPMPTCDSSWSNCDLNTSPQPSPIDTFESLRIRYPRFESGWEMWFTEKVGLRYADFTAQAYWPGGSMGYSGGCGIKLVYYKSDSLTWIDPDYYLGITETAVNQISFQLSPNPANETITLSAETETASEPFNVLVYDITGACVRNIQPNSIRSLTIPVNDLSPGYYVIKVSNGNHYLPAKGFIIAR